MAVTVVEVRPVGVGVEGGVVVVPVAVPARGRQLGVRVEMMPVVVPSVAMMNENSPIWAMLKPVRTASGMARPEIREPNVIATALPTMTSAEIAATCPMFS